MREKKGHASYDKQRADNLEDVIYNFYDEIAVRTAKTIHLLNHSQVLQPISRNDMSIYFRHMYIYIYI